MPRKENIVGQTFNKLTAIERLREGYKRTMYRCKCVCGNETIVSNDKLKNDHTKSCGCMKPSYDQGKVKGIRNSWRGMKKRCNDTKGIYYKYYKAKGISVSDEWSTFKKFYEDMHETWQKGLELDRINGQLGYYKNNCRWSTELMQQRNKSNIKLSKRKADNIRKSSLSVLELSLKYGVSKSTIKSVKSNKIWIL